MGTAEEGRAEHQRRPHQFSPTPMFHASPAAGSWPLEKLSDADVPHAHDMDVDPSLDGNQREHGAAPSPSNHPTSVFHFGEPAPQPANFAGLVATPITRFLTKQTFGYIPKPSFPSPSDGVAPRSTPSSPMPGPQGNANGKMPSLRLPSLSAAGSLNHSPLPSPQGSFSLPVGETLSRLFGSASLGNNSAPGSPATATPPPMRGSTVTLPPLKRACLSPTTTLPPLAQHLSLDDICRPFRYQRSMSCPSDAMARPAVDQQEVEAQVVPPVVVQPSDVRKYRVERSNSVDASAVLAMRDARQRALYGGEGYSHESSEDFHDWLDRPNSDRHPLASLAESAHAMQLLEQNRSTNLDSPRSITSASGSGDESANPFEVSDSSELRREKKLCAFPHCSSNAVTRGLCISHGGGRRCQRKGCTRGAQSKGLCVAHGGGRICKSKGCSNIQRSMGLCIRHGGGKRCSVPGCQKGVVRQDLCTAHGGKRKCKVEDCNKHVKKKGLCRSHANSVLGTSAISSPRDAMSPEYSN